MDTQQLFINLIDIMQSKTERETWVGKKVAEISSLTYRIENKFYANPENVNSSEFKQLLIEVFSASLALSVSPRHARNLKNSNANLSNLLIAFYQEGQEFYVENIDYSDKDLVMELKKAASNFDVRRIIQSVSALFSMLNVEIKEVCRHLLANFLIADYRIVRGLPDGSTNLLNEAEGKADIDWLREVIGILLLDDPYASLESIKSSSFAIMDNIFKINEQPALSL